MMEHSRNPQNRRCFYPQTGHKLLSCLKGGLMPKKYREAFLFIVFSAVAIILVMMTGQTAATPSVGLTPHGYLPVALRAENTPTFTPIPTNTAGSTNTPTSTVTNTLPVTPTATTTPPDLDNKVYIPLVSK
jgi:hypothetical protein